MLNFVWRTNQNVPFLKSHNTILLKNIQQVYQWLYIRLYQTNVMSNKSCPEHQENQCLAVFGWSERNLPLELDIGVDRDLWRAQFFCRIIGLWSHCMYA